MSFGSLPPVDQSLLPPDIRSGPRARRDAYTAALGFEQQLVEQLTSSLAASAQGTFGGGEETSNNSSSNDDALTGGSPYASLLPDALASGVMGAGGLGLARQLTDAIAPPAPTTPGGATP